MIRNKTTNVKPFPGYNCSEDRIHDQGTSNNFPAVMTYGVLKNFEVLQGRWPGLHTRSDYGRPSIFCYFLLQ
jgi:hypothetical protein